MTRFQIEPRGGGKYAVVDVRTGQCRYLGPLEGARQMQAQLMAGAR